MLARLVGAPASIGELAQPFAMSLPAVSKHLRVLERAGLVRRSIDGRVHRCFFEAAPLEAADEWIGRHRLLWEDALESLASFVAKDER
jgi:DNA-binding transcriptional ArsR family regulator